MLRIASVNQDRGIGPDKKKGASVHLLAMRAAFCELGAQVFQIDEPQSSLVVDRLEDCHRSIPLSLIYERYALGQSVAACYALEHGIPYVVEVNAPLAQEQERWRATKERAEDRFEDQRLFRAADAILAVSTEVASYCAARGADPDCIQVVPNGVDTNVFKPRTEKDQVINYPATARDPITIGFHGRLRPWHEFERLIASCKTLVDDGEALRLRVVGEGEFESLLAASLPLEFWDVLGWQPYPEIAKHVASFDIVPLCYGSDRACYFSPLKLMESMACGAVPVVPAIGDLPSTVTDNVNGLLYPPGDTESMTEAIRRLMHDPRLLHRLSRAAIKTAANHSWLSVAQIALDVLQPRTPSVGGGLV